MVYNIPNPSNNILNHLQQDSENEPKTANLGIEIEPYVSNQICVDEQSQVL